MPTAASESIEMEPLSAVKDEGALASGRNITSPSEGTDIELWSWGAARSAKSVNYSVALLYSLPLLAYPRFILFLAGSEQPRTTLNPLESFLSIHLGLGLVCVALAIIFGIPSAPIIPSQGEKTNPNHPLLVPVTLCMLLSCLISYNTNNISTLGTITSTASGLIGIWGLYVILFGNSSSISKTTGADKRTSRFLFGNKAAASSIKKQWKKDHIQR